MEMCSSPQGVVERSEGRVSGEGRGLLPFQGLMFSEE